MKVEWGDIPSMVESALREYGPMTGYEIAALVPASTEFINKALRRMRTPSRRRQPLMQQRVHVAEWTNDAEGQRSFPRPIYRLGHGINVPRPPPIPRRTIVAQQRRRKLGKTRMNFVFNLGAPP